MAHNNDPVDSVSRRAFFKTVGLGSVATTILTGAGAEAQTAPAGLGPGAVPVRLMVNGRAHDLKVEPRVTLLDAVRDHAGLTGNKRVCDRGTCGACTMIVDGRAVYGCSILAVDVEGREIRTVDGFAAGDRLHPVQEAFCNADALQCGFCTPGFVVATVALLEKYPNPTADQIRRGLDGNVCRCGSFKGIFDAATAAARQMRAAHDLPPGAVLAGGSNGEVTRG